MLLMVGVSEIVAAQLAQVTLMAGVTVVAGVAVVTQRFVRVIGWWQSLKLLLVSRGSYLLVHQ